MRYAKIIRLFSIAIVLSLLIAVIPATPAYAGSIDLDPEEGTVGSTVTITGEGFNKSTETTDRFAIVYFSSQEATMVDDIDDEVTIYEIVKDAVYLDEYGEFVKDFTVPEELNDGDDDEDVTSGTYYIYVCHYVGEPPIVATRIRAVAEFIVTAGEIELSDESGTVGTEVEITGTEFSSDKDVTIEYDGDEVDIESGDDETDGNGEFVSSIFIPESTAGDHTITVTVSGSEVEAEFTVEPEIFLSPTSGEVDTTVTVSGTGFGRRQDVVVYLDTVGVLTVTTDGKGSFDDAFTVPELEADIYDVEAEDEDENLDTAKFTVTVPPPPSPEPTPEPTPTPPTSPTSASISATSGHVGSDIIIGGAGFEVDAEITVKYDGEEVATATSDSNGVFVAPFRIPVSEAGDHTITASDGTNTEKFTFTMESVAPPVPAPLLPEMGVKVESPILFDWKAVTDDSPPLTYNFQIASSRDFTEPSLVLKKEGLTKSEYTIAEAEMIELIGKEAPYYWRVRAIDGASNKGDWTGAGEFYIAPSFGLPNWAIYTLLGLGGLVLFAVGYWLGRRTAYYY